MTEAHHAYILAGSRSASARWTSDWCGEHSIPMVGNPDLFRMGGEDAATIESAHAVVSEAQKSPFQHPFRIIVWNLGYLSEEVSNTLLKTLEELPEKTRMFLCVPSGTQLLKTVTSRVPVITLDPSAEDVVLVKKFLNMRVSDRLEYLEKEFFKSESPEIRIGMMELLSGIGEVISLSGGPETSLLPEIVKLVGYLNQSSATPKYVMEYLAHMLPEGLRA